MGALGFVASWSEVWRPWGPHLWLASEVGGSLVGDNALNPGESDASSGGWCRGGLC